MVKGPATWRARARLALPLAVALLAAGCWDYRDVNDRSLVLGLAMDTAPGGGHQATVELAVPMPLEGAAGARGGPAGGGMAPRSVTLTARSATSPHALASLHDEWSRPLSFGHLTALLYGEDYARQEGIRDEPGCSGCHPEISLGAHVFTTRGQAARYIRRAPPGGEPWPKGTFLLQRRSVRLSLERGGLARASATRSA